MRAYSIRRLIPLSHCHKTAFLLPFRSFFVFLQKFREHTHMKCFYKCIAAVCLLMSTLTIAAQTTGWQDIYKVKKKDTVYGISKKYGITVEELMNANPVISGADFKLRKGERLFIPYPKKQTPAATPEAKPEKQAKSEKMDVVRVGVMLPLHDVDGDGRRMVEYYRGLLMGCDALKAKGLSVAVNAWNVPIDADIRQTLLDENAAKCDIIFGPLYTKQVKSLGDFCKRNDIKLVIPFSISGNDVASNDHIFQVYQPADDLNGDAVDAFLERFPNHHPVFIDCNDTTSKKGMFTFELRKRLEAKGITYNITNLKSSEVYFAKAFSNTKPNVVVLNTGRSPELNVAFAKLDGLTTTHPELAVSMFGYTEWLMYTKVYLNYFHKYDTYIPTTFYYNPLASATSRFEETYRTWFKSDMQTSLPRFALTGYDHANFFIGGLHESGRSFAGTNGQSRYKPLQTPLKFVRVAGKGGMQNDSFMLVHYKRNHEMESISY